MAEKSRVNNITNNNNYGKKVASEHDQLCFGVAIQNEMLFFLVSYLLCCSTNHKHTQIYLEWVEYTANTIHQAAENYIRSTFSLCVFCSYNDRRLVRSTMHRKMFLKKITTLKNSYAIYLIWSHDVVLRIYFEVIEWVRFVVNSY